MELFSILKSILDFLKTYKEGIILMSTAIYGLSFLIYPECKTVREKVIKFLKQEKRKHLESIGEKKKKLLKPFATKVGLVLEFSIELILTIVYVLASVSFVLLTLVAKEKIVASLVTLFFIMQTKYCFESTIKHELVRIGFKGVRHS